MTEKKRTPLEKQHYDAQKALKLQHRVLVPKLSKDACEIADGGLSTIADKWPRLFMGMVHHRTTRGELMTFADKPWLTEIYKDNSREMVIIKCSQVHMTEHALCAMFTLARAGLRGMYVLPSKEHRKTFVSDRVNRQKDYSPLYDNAIKEGQNEADSNVYKSIFGSGWKFVGSNVKKDFFEFPCDVLFFDEYDELDQNNLFYAYDRIANVARPVVWKFGNPTRENFGIHAEYMKSKQYEWHVPCEHCKHEQVLDWYKHFVVQNQFHEWRLRDLHGNPICTNCKKPFNRLGYGAKDKDGRIEWNAGRWVAKNPSSPVAGYRISRLFVDKGNQPSDIIFMYKKFIDVQNNPTGLQNFHNNWLGVPYENIDFKITVDALQNAVYQDGMQFDPKLYRTVMGVDQGKHFTCTISMVWEGVIIDVAYANVDRWSDVTRLEDQFNVVCTVVDAQGGGYADTRDFVKGKGTRWMCYYRPKDQLRDELNVKPEDQVVEVNRTEILDLATKSILEGQTKIRMDFASQHEGHYVKQMIASARITDAGGRPVWTKGTDHFFHSNAYRYVAWRISGMNHSIVTVKTWYATRAVPKDSNPTDKIEARIIGDTEADGPLARKRQKRRGWHIE